MVLSRVLPPAPYVTETKLGCRSCSPRIVSRRDWSPASVFGGKNSNEKHGRPVERSSRMRMGGLAAGSVLTAGRRHRLVQGLFDRLHQILVIRLDPAVKSIDHLAAPV